MKQIKKSLSEQLALLAKTSKKCKPTAGAEVCLLLTFPFQSVHRLFTSVFFNSISVFCIIVMNRATCTCSNTYMPAPSWNELLQPAFSAFQWWYLAKYLLPHFRQKLPSSRFSYPWLMFAASMEETRYKRILSRKDISCSSLIKITTF